MEITAKRARLETFVSETVAFAQCFERNMERSPPPPPLPFGLRQLLIIEVAGLSETFLAHLSTACFSKKWLTISLRVTLSFGFRRPAKDIIEVTVLLTRLTVHLAGLRQPGHALPERPLDEVVLPTFDGWVLASRGKNGKHLDVLKIVEADGGGVVVRQGQKTKEKGVEGEVVGGCGRLWEVVGGCGRLWEVVGGCGRLWEVVGG
ncbi:hypothetical protein QBC38DRAFT_216179 [Podospora fimiseda]|uniref:Uncharacterized protein n=1 Tax=Podospora fimiseda TaxID=252190 RepID=A0AAN7BPP0_9PEZI|nr:hypothetical protein QBC38DRAFT_216179 [Podospora fimiseda]